MTKEQKSAELDYEDALLTARLKRETSNLARCYLALKDREAITWPSEDSEIDALAPNLIGLDKNAAKLIGVGWRMGIDWLKSRIGGKRE